MTKAGTVIDWAQVRRRLQASEEALHAVLHPGPEAIRDVYDQRAQRLARRAGAAAAAEDETAVLIAQVAETRVAIELDHVLEVGPLTRCTPLPGSAANVCGVFTHRGEVRSVLDLGGMIGQPVGEPGRPGFFILVRAEPGERLLRVDQVLHVASVQKTDWMGSEQTGLAWMSNLARGVHRDGTVLLDAESLLAESLAFRDLSPAQNLRPS